MGLPTASKLVAFLASQVLWFGSYRVNVGDPNEQNYNGRLLVCSKESKNNLCLSSSESYLKPGGISLRFPSILHI